MTMLEFVVNALEIAEQRDDPWDGDDVEAICKFIEIELNHASGNITTPEYIARIARHMKQHEW